jgi:hypothetical protein
MDTKREIIFTYIFSSVYFLKLNVIIICVKNCKFSNYNHLAKFIDSTVQVNFSYTAYSNISITASAYKLTQYAN